MECKRLPTDYEIRDFSLKIMLLSQKFWFNSFLKTPKNLPLGAGLLLRKRIFLIEKINDSTVNTPAFNYYHQSQWIFKPSIILQKFFNARNNSITLIMIEVVRHIHIDDLNIRLVACKSLCITLPL